MPQKEGFRETASLREDEIQSHFFLKHKPCIKHFHSHSIKNVNRSHAMNELKNFRRYSRLLNNCQVLGVCGCLYLSYWLKSFAQIYKARCGDATLTYLAWHTSEEHQYGCQKMVIKNWFVPCVRLSSYEGTQEAWRIR